MYASTVVSVDRPCTVAFLWTLLIDVRLLQSECRISHVGGSFVERYAHIRSGSNPAAEGCDRYFMDVVMGS